MTLDNAKRFNPVKEWEIKKLYSNTEVPNYNINNIDEKRIIKHNYAWFLVCIVLLGFFLFMYDCGILRSIWYVLLEIVGSQILQHCFGFRYYLLSNPIKRKIEYSYWKREDEIRYFWTSFSVYKNTDYSNFYQNRV